MKAGEVKQQHWLGLGDNVNIDDVLDLMSTYTRAAEDELKWMDGAVVDAAAADDDIMRRLLRIFFQSLHSYFLFYFHENRNK